MLGRRIKKVRQAAGMTQTELAARAGLNQSYIARLENGERLNPSLAVLRRLAKALRIDPSTLLEKEIRS